MSQTLWVNEGSYMSSPKLSQQMRAQALPGYVFRQFVDKKDGLGSNKGDSVQFTKRLRIDTAGGTLVETTTMPQNRIKVLKGTATVQEYGNGVLYTQKIETLSQFTMKTEYEKGLVDDQHLTLDSAVATEFKKAKFRAVCTATTKTGVTFTTNGTFAATSTVNCSLLNFRAIVDYAKQKQIPKMGGSYNVIGATNFVSSIYDDLLSVAQYTDPEKIYKDEVGKVYGARVVEDNNVLSNTIGTGSTFGEAVLFGDEAVAEAVALPEEIRYESTDVGRSKKLAWYALLGFSKIWDLASDDANSTGKGIERIIYIGSL